MVAMMAAVSGTSAGPALFGQQMVTGSMWGPGEGAGSLDQQARFLALE